MCWRRHYWLRSTLTWDIITIHAPRKQQFIKFRDNKQGIMFSQFWSQLTTRTPWQLIKSVRKWQLFSFWCKIIINQNIAQAHPHHKSYLDNLTQLFHGFGLKVVLAILRVCFWHLLSLWNWSLRERLQEYTNKITMKLSIYVANRGYLFAFHWNNWRWL